MICLSVSLVEPIKILKMSNYAGQPLNTSFAGSSWSHKYFGDHRTMRRPKSFVLHLLN